MAINQINLPQRQPKRDALDRIAQGLQIAQGIFGTYQGYKAGERADAQSEREASLLPMQKEKMAGEIDLNKAQAQKLRAEAMLPKTTPGQQALDKEYGQQFAQRTAQGGYADALKGLSQIDEAINALKKTDSATGPVVGLVPKWGRDILTPGGAAIQDSVEEIVQRNLRNVLGAQFTEKEGTRLIERAYNPRLSEGENIKRLERLKTQIGQAVKLQQAADDYFNEHGTMTGFKGRTMSTAADFDLEGKGGGGAGPAPAQGAAPYQDEGKEKRYQQWKAKQGIK